MKHSLILISWLDCWWLRLTSTEICTICLVLICVDYHIFNCLFILVFVHWYWLKVKYGSALSLILMLAYPVVAYDLPRLQWYFDESNFSCLRENFICVIRNWATDEYLWNDSLINNVIVKWWQPFHKFQGGRKSRYKDMYVLVDNVCVCFVYKDQSGIWWH